MPKMHVWEFPVKESVAREVAKCLELKLPKGFSQYSHPALVDSLIGGILALAEIAAKTINKGREQQSKRTGAKKARAAGRKGQ